MNNKNEEHFRKQELQFMLFCSNIQLNQQQQ